jgi:hypothetical protein
MIRQAGACAEQGISVGSTLLSVDGVPLRGMGLEDVKQLTMGLVGTHVCVRYRPPGVHAEYPPIERVLTRLPASYSRAAGFSTARSHISHWSGASSVEPNRDQQNSTRKVQHADSRPESSSIDTFRSSVSSWFTNMGLLTSARNGGQDPSNVRLANSNGTLATVTSGHSQRASQREAFLKEQDDDYTSLRPGLIRHIADEYR